MMCVMLLSLIIIWRVCRVSVVKRIAIDVGIVMVVVNVISSTSWIRMHGGLGYHHDDLSSRHHCCCWEWGRWKASGCDEDQKTRTALVCDAGYYREMREDYCMAYDVGWRKATGYIEPAREFQQGHDEILLELLGMCWGIASTLLILRGRLVCE